MTKYHIMESALEERYEYLEELQQKKIILDNLIKSMEDDIEQLIIRLLQEAAK